MCKNLKSYARCRDPPHTHHNFLANCINLTHQGMIAVADNNFFDDNIVRITIKNKFVPLYMKTCIFNYSKEISPPYTHFLILYHEPSAVVNTVIFFATCIQWYGTPILWGYNACMYTEDQFFGGMMHVHDIELSL